MCLPLSSSAQEQLPPPLHPAQHGGSPELVLDFKTPSNSSISLRPVYDYAKLDAGQIKNLLPQQRNCATTQMEEKRRRLEAGESLGDFENWLQQELMLTKNQKGAEQLYTLPVVVHVIYQNEVENISLEQVQSQIAVLNQDFRRTNEDQAFTQKEFRKVAADTKIQFQLARRDPRGKPTDGVNRVAATGGPFSAEYVNKVIKPNTIWNPNEYMNIWVCNLADGVLGYAQFPNSSGLTGIPVASGAAQTDGVVIHFQAFGTLGTAQLPFNKGRTATHEVGHWLGLMHIWGDGGCEADDFCKDTPPVSGPNYGCAPTFTSCEGGPVMTQNFMDYTDDNCMNLFTEEQKLRMRTVIKNSPRRQSLIRSRALQPLPIPPSPDFVADVLYGCDNLEVQFQDRSAHQPSKYQWEFLGGKPAKSSSPNPVVRYRKPGSYPVRLTVSNAYGQQSLQRDAYIQVVDSGRPLPYYADFELAARPEGAYLLNVQDDAARWQRSRKVGGHGKSTASLLFNNYDNKLIHSMDVLMLPIMAFEQDVRPVLRFDLAYSPYNQNWSDTLGVFIAAGCSQRFEAVYYKGGENLSTAFASVQPFVPLAEEWRTEAIDLSGYIGQPFVQIAFVNISGGGNNLYLDNIRLEAEPLPAPEAAFEAAKLELCAGEWVQFTDFSKNGPTHWQWSFPGAKVASDTTPNPKVLYPAAGIYDVSLTVSNSRGQHSIRKQGYIRVLPGPDLQVSGPREPVCPGEKVVLHATGGNEYEWLWGEEDGAEIGPTLTIYPQKSQLYQVSSTAANGCRSTRSVEVKLIVEDELEVTPAEAVICQGEEIALHASGADTYHWSPASGLQATAGATVLARPQHSTTYKLEAVSGGCPLSREIEVEVKAPPANVNITGLKEKICEGEHLSLRASGGATYKWSPVQDFNTPEGEEVELAPLGSAAYRLLAANEAGCEAELTFEVEVVPYPEAEIYAPQTTICRGGSLLLQAEGTASAYQWFGPGLEPLGSGMSLEIQPRQNATYTLVGSNEGGCSDTSQVFITLRDPQPIRILTERTHICAGESTLLTAEGGMTYHWSPARGLDATTGRQVMASPDRRTTYTVISTDEYGCRSSGQITIDVANDAPPRADFSIASPFVCVGDEVEIQDYSSNATTYRWIFPGGFPEESFDSSPRITYQQPGTYDVVLVVTGCQGTDRLVRQGAITVSEPGFLQVDPPNASLCLGESVELTARGAAEYSWYAAEEMRPLQGAVVRVAPRQSTEYLLVGTDFGGCRDTLRVPIEVNGMENSLEVRPAAPSICEGESIQLQAWGAGEIRWFPATGLSADKGEVVEASPVHSTTYLIEGRDEDGCIHSLEVPLEVKPKPSLRIYSEQAPEICQGESIRLLAEGARTYRWDEHSSLNTLIGPSVLATPTGSIAYRVQGTAENGCSADTTFEVVVHPLPEVVLHASDTAMCLGDTLSLQAEGAHRYVWTPLSGIVVPDADSLGSIQISPAASVTYIVKGTNEWGCSSTASVNIGVTIPQPLSIYPAAAEICAGEQLELRVSGGNGSYFWEKQAGLLESRGELARVAPQQTTTYTVRSYDPSGSGCINMGSITVKVKPKAGISLLADAGTICEGDALSLQARGGSQYRWLSLGNVRGMGDSRAVEGQRSMRLMPEEDHTYRIVGIDANGCLDTASLHVKVLPFRAAEQEDVRQIDLATTAGLVHFEDETSEASSWEWRLGHTLISRQQAFTHIFDTTGIYVLSLRVSNDACTDELRQEIEVVNSSRIQDLQQLQVEGLPVLGKLRLSFESPRRMYLRARLLDADGQEVLSDLLQPAPGPFERTFDLQGLPPGTYQLVLSDDHQAQGFVVEME